MASALEQLFFTITLLDKVSGPSKGVCKSFQKMQQQGKDAFQLMGKGAIGITAAATSLDLFSGRGREFSKALGEVASLDTPAAELDKLAAASKKFTFQFGGDATKIAASAYDIQSAI
ncbi:MAG: phage tail tape measure protein, partial [Lentisphaerae bacterium]